MNMPTHSSAGKENSGAAPYGRASLAFKFLKYYFSASNGKGHGIHSPFVFDFINTVLRKSGGSGSFAPIEHVRNSLLRNQTMIEVEDFGAGSSRLKGPERSIASIASSSLKHPRYSRLMHSLVARYRPSRILELGTSFGITTAYMAAANPDAEVVTIEGSSSIAAEASRNFQRLGLTNIRQVSGRFADTLGHSLAQMQKADLVFLDGDHRLQPTLDYFQMILPYVHGGTILVFDDIHWSPQMESAWEIIKSHPSVRLTIDVFFLGLVFFSPDFTEKRHFTLRY